MGLNVPYPASLSACIASLVEASSFHVPTVTAYFLVNFASGMVAVSTVIAVKP